MIFKDYYKILGLETNKVSVEEIKIAYREQAKKISSRLECWGQQIWRTFKRYKRSV